MGIGKKCGSIIYPEESSPFALSGMSSYLYGLLPHHLVKSTQMAVEACCDHLI